MGPTPSARGVGTMNRDAHVMMGLCQCRRNLILVATAPTVEHACAASGTAGDLRTWACSFGANTATSSACSPTTKPVSQRPNRATYGELADIANQPANDAVRNRSCTSTTSTTTGGTTTPPTSKPCALRATSNTTGRLTADGNVRHPHDECRLRPCRRWKGSPTSSACRWIDEARQHWPTSSRCSVAADSRGLVPQCAALAWRQLLDRGGWGLT